MPWGGVFAGGSPPPPPPSTPRPPAAAQFAHESDYVAPSPNEPFTLPEKTSGSAPAASTNTRNPTGAGGTWQGCTC